MSKLQSMNGKLTLAVAALLVSAFPLRSMAQTSPSSSLSSAVQENFTGSGTANSWYFFNGACLTAATTVTTTSPGQIPACIGDPYYGSQTQVGGNSGNLNAHPDSTDPTSKYYGGALRLTNDANDQSGAIISNFSFPLQASGLQVTFTTETYEGDSGGANGDGADGISFFLQDATLVGALQATLTPSIANPTLGDWGGSLGYTCSNSNNSSAQGYDGMVGGYLGLGIDEYGNFLNPGDNTSSGPGYVPNRIGLRGSGSTKWAYLTSLSAAVVAANAAAGTGSLYTTPTAGYYPFYLSSAQQVQAVQKTCSTGRIWDYSLVALGLAANPIETNLQVPNYTAIPNAYKVLTTKIANEAATMRGYGPGSGASGSSYGIPISYNLTITTAGLLSLSYSYNGGAYQQIITGQNITQNNGPIPAAVRFGFAGSTGGSRNIHEIMCFSAIPQNASSSSAGLNEKQTAKVQIGTQVYFAFYNANNWTGSLTSQNLYTPAGDTIPNDLQIDPVVNWDASCVLTGVPSGQTCAKTGAVGPIQPQPTARTILTWNGSSGIPFEWSSLNPTAQGLLDAEEEAAAESITSWRLNYLRGSRTDEQNALGVDPNTNPTPPNPAGLRARTSVLADIIDSSPTWVGPPQTAYPNTWTDYLQASADPMPENSGTTYGNFASAGTTGMNQEQQRLNVVYVGANDGMLHGFETGSFNSDGSYNETNNDGKEVFAYMPGYVLDNIDDAFTTTLNATTTGGVTTYTPAYTTNVSSDFTDPQYGHHFSVDAPPGTGDLFYNGTWHTWLVGGLGPGGKAIYALDITDPNQFSESNAANLVIGEWSSETSTTPTTTTTTSGSPPTTTTTITGLNTFSTGSTLTCANDTSTYSGEPALAASMAKCANSLGNTYGIPQIRRMHNGQWAAIFGNGQHSSTGDAGIFIMLVNPSGGTTVPTVQFYYLTTGWANAGLGGVSTTSTNLSTGTLGSTTYGPTSNGIYYASPTDLDGDHIVDYIYAGDMQGNIWRFDVTATSAATWASTPPVLIYSTSTSSTPGNATQPITTKVIIASIASTNSNARLLVEFGTGQQTAFSNNSAASYSQSQQALYGVWDSNMSCWNSMSSVQFATEPAPHPSTPCATPAYTTTPPIYGTTYLQAQTILASYSNNTSACSASVTCTEYYRTVSSNPICWANLGSTCTGGQTATQYGWYLNLSTGNANAYDANDLYASSAPYANPYVYEQVIFSPTFADGALLINTTIPPTTSLRACQSTAAGGWTMAINPATGGAFSNSFFGDANHNFLNINNQVVSGIALGGTGSVSVVANGNQAYMLTQTTNGTGAIVAINPQGTLLGSRLTWTEKR